MRKNDIFRTARRFYFDYFRISVQRFIRDKKHYKTISLGEQEVYITLPSQIYSSCFRDYMVNFVKNIKAFPNAIKSLVVYLLWRIFLIHLKYKSQNMRKKVSGQNDTIAAALFTISLIYECPEFIFKYVLTWKYVNMNF